MSYERNNYGRGRGIPKAGTQGVKGRGRGTLGNLSAGIFFCGVPVAQ